MVTQPSETPVTMQLVRTVTPSPSSIFRAEAESDLRDAGREHDPVSLDVLEIIEQEARYGDVAEVEITRRLGNVGERGVVGMKRQGNEGDKAVRLVLDFAQFHQVIDPLFFGFDVSIEHGGIGGQTVLVGLFGRIEPDLAADFVVADDAPHAGMENFGAAARTRIDAGFFHAA